MYRILLFSLAIFSFSGLTAQQYEQRQEFSVMNPTSFEMSRFELTPVNKYTGKANVNFPLCGIELEGKQLALSLSYDTGGVRVAQEATWVGLGWNLGGIPVITHQINQRSDIGSKERPLKGYCYEPPLPEGGITQAYSDWLANNSISLPYGQPDTQPDVFVANLIGATVKFQLTKKDLTTTVQAQIVDESNALITYHEADQNFTIVDEEGYQYNFTQTEYATTWSQDAGSLGLEWEPDQITGVDGSTQWNFNDVKVPTAWYVSQIISPDGEILQFRYDDQIDGEPNVTVSHPTYSSTISVDICGTKINNGNFNGWQFPNFENTQATRTIQEVKVLSEIENTTTGDKLVFKTDSRLDIHPYDSGFIGGYGYAPGSTDNTPKRLTEIELLSATKSIKKVTFQQSYFNEFQVGNADAANHLRLKLDGYKIYDQQYAFKYKCDDALPEKHSKDSDFWGFYNGAENVWRVPYVKVEGNCPWENPDIELDEIALANGAKKGSSFNHALIGSLSEIRYPTGGTTQFSYETNEVTMNPFDNTLNADDFNAPYLFNHNLEAGYPKEAPSDPDTKTYAVGGLRVEAVTNTDKEGNALLKKSYTYSNTNGSGDVVSTGRLMDPFHFFRSSIRASGDQSQVVTTYDGVLIYGTTISNNSVFGRNLSASGSFMGYGQVTETIESTEDASTNGKIVSQFINIPNESLSDQEVDQSTGQTYSYIVESIPFNYESANGKLVNEVIYDSDNNIERKTEIDYLVNVYSNVSNSNYYQTGYKLYFSTLNGIQYISGEHEYDARKMVTWLTKSKSEEHYQNGKLVKAERNVYNDHDRIKAVEKSISRTPTIDEDWDFDVAKSERTEFYYPYDNDYQVNTESISGNLLAENRIGQPIYTRYYNNNQFVGHQLTKFSVDPTYGFTKPEGVYYDKVAVPLAQMENRVKYEAYDGYGNLVQYRQADGSPVSAIWGHDGKYMVAKIENATYQQIENLQAFGGGSGLDLHSSGLNQSQKDALNGLANTLSTFYDYDPLVGITQMTDARDYETNYTYDTYNRLSEIRDEANNLLEDYEYEFANVTLYPDQELSECFNPLTLSVSPTFSSQQYVDLVANASGGVGNYQFTWYLGIGTSNTQFSTNPQSSTTAFNWIICCDTEQYVKVVVQSGTQTVSTILRNPNYGVNCPTDPCQNSNN